MRETPSLPPQSGGERKLPNLPPHDRALMSRVKISFKTTKHPRTHRGGGREREIVILWHNSRSSLPASNHERGGRWLSCTQ